MADPHTIATTRYLDDVRGGSRPAPLDVHAWTGRCALSSATSTPRPHIATAGTRRTRVSAMRFLAARIVPSLHKRASAGSGSTRARREPGYYHALSG